jgi:hypothetical protein
MTLTWALGLAVLFESFNCAHPRSEVLDVGERFFSRQPRGGGQKFHKGGVV